MSLRSFKDSKGGEWRVWDVVPQYAVARDADMMTPGLEGGWLCFENGSHKRRLSPIPAAWEDATEQELEGYCTRAKTVGRRTEPA
ncbi:MAG TPA: hypothetical protein VFQ45_00260 [Longimicrobium sp.]|nr:hypothetical protein [Longimicrobium sp.]